AANAPPAGPAATTDDVPVIAPASPAETRASGDAEPVTRTTPGKSSSVSASAGLPSQIGRFQVRARLGAGAFGTVYRAYDPHLDREVALKVPQPGMMDTPKRVERFLREAKAAAQL